VVGIRRLQGIIVGLLALIATAAYGQQPSQLPGQQPSLRLPGIRPSQRPDQQPSQRLTITPSLSLGERYDDNVFETQTDKQDDFITVISPGIRVQYFPTALTLGTQFDLDYRAAIEFFADHSSQNNVDHRLSLSLVSPLAPSLNVSLRNLFRITEDPLERGETLSDPTGLRPASQQQRQRTIRNEADARADVRLGGRTSLGVLFRNLIDDVDVPEELDEFRYTVGPELGYALNVARDSRVFVSYLVTFESFRNNGIVPTPNADASFQVHAIGTGVRHELTPTVTIDAGLGYSFTQSDAPEKDGHDGVIGNVRLTKTFNRGQASLGYARRFTADGSTGDVIIDDTVSAMATVNLTGRLTARLDGNVSWSNYQSTTLFTLATDNSDQRFLSIRPGLTYQILRPWGVSVAYIYAYTDYTDSAIANYSDHRLLLSTQYAFREWLTLGLSYRYGARHVQGNATVQRGVDEFSGNEVMLTLTASPSLRF
jgi:hypothetical protein